MYGRQLFPHGQRQQSDYAASGEAGGRLPPQEIAADMKEAAGSQAQAAAGYAPWESVEEKEEAMGDMGRLLEEGEKEGAGQGARTMKAGAGDQLGRICRLCDGEATGDCTKGNCEDCCMSNRGEGPFNCCRGPHSSSHSSVSHGGGESAAGAWEAVDAQQAAEAGQAVDVEHAADAEQAGDVENAAVFQGMHNVFQGMQQELDSRRQGMEHSRQQATPQGFFLSSNYSLFSLVHSFS